MNMPDQITPEEAEYLGRAVLQMQKSGKPFFYAHLIKANPALLNGDSLATANHLVSLGLATGPHLNDAYDLFSEAKHVGEQWLLMQKAL